MEQRKHKEDDKRKVAVDEGVEEPAPDKWQRGQDKECGRCPGNKAISVFAVGPRDADGGFMHRICSPLKENKREENEGGVLL